MEATWGGEGQDGREGVDVGRARGGAPRADAVESVADEGFSPDRAHPPVISPATKTLSRGVDATSKGCSAHVAVATSPPSIVGEAEVVVPRGARTRAGKCGRSVGGARSRRRGARRDFARHSRFRFRGAATVRCPDERFRENASTSDARFAPARRHSAPRGHDAMLANLGSDRARGGRKRPGVRCASTGRPTEGTLQGVPGKGICEHRRVRRQCKGRGLGHLRAQEAATPLQGVARASACTGESEAGARSAGA